ncbi:MAG: HEAT repeat domain-containing protein [Planctomycetes bacterium]|nr:HEAT repeat domain-containing protein [Planctomycetota bacterium]
MAYEDSDIGTEVMIDDSLPQYGAESEISSNFALRASERFVPGWDDVGHWEEIADEEIIVPFTLETWDLDFNRHWMKHTVPGYLCAIGIAVRVNSLESILKLMDVVSGDIPISKSNEESGIEALERLQMEMRWNSSYEETQERLMELRSLHNDCARKDLIKIRAAEAMKEFTDEVAIRYLSGEALGSSSVDVLIAVLDAIEHHGWMIHRDAVANLRRMLGVIDPRVRTGVLRALARIGSSASISEIEGVMFGTNSRQVRMAALDGLVAMGSVSSIPKIIEVMKNQTGRMLFEFEKRLWKLTGQTFYPQIELWGDWLAINFDSIQSEKYVRADEPAPEIDIVGLPTFFGIPVASTAAVFAIDSSFSRSERLRPRETDPISSNNLPEISYLSEAKRETISAIRNMDGNSLIGCVFFDDEQHFPFPGTLMKRNVAATRLDLFGWMRSVSESTDQSALFEALDTIFHYYSSGHRFGAPAFHDAVAMDFESVPDTIYLVTNGDLDGGSITDVEIIYKHVTDWAELYDVEINVIEVGGQGRQMIADRDNGGRHKIRLMEALALKTGGTWKMVE